MDDLIYRHAAIDVAKQHWYKPDIAKALEELPSAQPSLNQGQSRIQSSGCISRQDAINEVEMAFKCVSFDKAERFIVENLNALPSAQPETFEWCHDCKEYDQEQHCCHRWSQQIRKTIEELEANYPQEIKDELLYWKERAAKWERDYYIRIKKGEPERKKGRWIKNSTHINCSVCKHCSWSLSFEDTVRQFNFCPNCGSLNGGEEE